VLYGNYSVCGERDFISRSKHASRRRTCSSPNYFQGAAGRILAVVAALRKLCEQPGVDGDRLTRGGGMLRGSSPLPPCLPFTTTVFAA